MKERIVIITGANSGIGKAAAFKFATESYTVIMACRNIEKSSKVAKSDFNLTFIVMLVTLHLTTVCIPTVFTATKF